MITINLLPAELRPIERTILPYLVASTILAITLLAVGTVYIADIAKSVSASNRLAENQQSLDALADVIAENQQLITRTNELAARVTAIQQIASDRVVWSQQIHYLVSLAPQNLWFSRLWVHAVPVTRTIMVYNPETKESVATPITEQQWMLQVNGYVATGRDGLRSAYPFMQATTTDEHFSKSFALERTINVEDTIFAADKSPVRKFEIEYILKKGVLDE